MQRWSSLPEMLGWLRLLGGPEEARAFVEKRLEEYERMWDGCGVKVEYYEES